MVVQCFLENCIIILYGSVLSTKARNSCSTAVERAILNREAVGSNCHGCLALSSSLSDAFLTYVSHGGASILIFKKCLAVQLEAE